MRKIGCMLMIGCLLFVGCANKETTESQNENETQKTLDEPVEKDLQFNKPIRLSVMNTASKKGLLIGVESEAIKEVVTKVFDIVAEPVAEEADKSFNDETYKCDFEALDKSVKEADYEALKVINEWQKTNTDIDTYHIHYLSALVYYDLKEYGLMDKELDEAMRRDVNYSNPDLWADKIVTLYASGQDEEAMALWTSVKEKMGDRSYLVGARLLVQESPFFEESKRLEAQVKESDLIWPVVNTTDHTLSREFGPERNILTGDPSFSKYISIALKRETPLVSIMDGTVVFAGNVMGKGNCIALKSGDFTVEYMCMSTIAVEMGQEIKQGSEVGTSGSTGYCTGPNLTMICYLEGLPVNPMVTNWK